MSAPTLIINGHELPQRARLDYRQTFERLPGGSSGRRMGDGSLFFMERWAKWSTTISAGGWVPAPLLSLPIGTPFEVHSVAALALRPGETLPDGWTERTDWPGKTFLDELGVEVRLVFPVLTVVTLTGARMVVGADPQWELAMEEA